MYRYDEFDAQFVRQRVTQCIELLGIHRTRRLRNIFVLLAKRQKNPPQLLPPQLIDAGVAGEPEQPRLELRRRLQTIERIQVAAGPALYTSWTRTDSGRVQSQLVVPVATQTDATLPCDV